MNATKIKPEEKVIEIASPLDTQTLQEMESEIDEMMRLTQKTGRPGRVTARFYSSVHPETGHVSLSVYLARDVHDARPRRIDNAVGCQLTLTGFARNGLEHESRNGWEPQN